MRKFLAGWLAATIVAAALKMIFGSLAWAVAGAPQLPLGADLLPNALSALTGAFFSYWLDFLIAFAAAYWISRRFPGSRLGIFMIAGCVAVIAPTAIFVGLRFLVALPWWMTFAELVFGAVAGLTSGWISKPAEAARASA